MRNHGTHACYVWGPEPGCVPGRGCRCDACRAGAAAYERSRQRRTAPAYVDAAAARGHIAWLRGQGVGLKAVARASGLAHGTLSKLVYGQKGNPPSRRIRKATEDAILRVTPANASDGARVDGSAYRADVRTLIERGWTRTAIATAVGVLPSNFRPEATSVTAAKARAVHALLAEPVPPRRSRWGIHEVPQPEDEADRAEAMRRAAEAERRAHYRHRDDPPPVVNPDVIAEPWRKRAACRLVADHERWIFWPEQGDRQATAAAKQVCQTCPVLSDCLAYAITAGELGVWGGTTDSERRRLRKLETAS